MVSTRRASSGAPAPSTPAPTSTDANVAHSLPAKASREMRKLQIDANPALGGRGSSKRKREAPKIEVMPPTPPLSQSNPSLHNSPSTEADLRKDSLQNHDSPSSRSGMDEELDSTPTKKRSKLSEPEPVAVPSTEETVQDVDMVDTVDQVEAVSSSPPKTFAEEQKYWFLPAVSPDLSEDRISSEEPSSPKSSAVNAVTSDNQHPLSKSASPVRDEVLGSEQGTSEDASVEEAITTTDVPDKSRSAPGRHSQEKAEPPPKVKKELQRLNIDANEALLSGSSRRAAAAAAAAEEPLVEDEETKEVTVTDAKQNKRVSRELRKLKVNANDALLPSLTREESNNAASGRPQRQRRPPELFCRSIPNQRQGMHDYLHVDDGADRKKIDLGPPPPQIIDYALAMFARAAGHMDIVEKLGYGEGEGGRAEEGIKSMRRNKEDDVDKQQRISDEVAIMQGWELVKGKKAVELKRAKGPEAAEIKEQTSPAVVAPSEEAVPEHKADDVLSESDSEGSIHVGTTALSEDGIPAEVAVPNEDGEDTALASESIKGSSPVGEQAHEHEQSVQPAAADELA